MTHKPRIVVTAAVVRRDDTFLVTRRQAGVHLEGYWEFPGGKCDPGESLLECLGREMLEVKQRIEAKDTAAGTQQMQKGIADDLAKLIEQAKKVPQARALSAEVAE